MMIDTLPIDHSRMKLGKKVPRIDSRTLRLARYLKGLPPPPLAQDWTKGITDWGMMLNDDLGDCTEAAKGHAVQVWTANLGTKVTVKDSDVLAAYETECGYVDGDPSTDNGGVEIDVLNAWRKNGFAGHKLLAYADTDPKNIFHTKQAITLFGGLYIGLNLPLTAQSQTVWELLKGKSWFRRLFRLSDSSDPGSWGGHAVFVPAYNTTGPICITWGKLKQMTWAFWLTYCDESHALLSQEWVDANVTTGFDLATLQSDLSAIAA